jgi:protein-disulfide isomerase
MRIVTATVIILVVTFVFAHGGYGQSAEDLRILREEVKALKASQAAMQKELQEIKNLLLASQAQPQAPVPFRETILAIDSGYVKGNKQAKLVLVEFSEYQCSFCARFARETMPQIEKEYIDTGKMRYVFMDFPLAMHAHAQKAAESASCAHEQGKYWEMHERLFANQAALGPEAFLKHAETLGLDVARFKQCLEGGKYAPKIRAATAEGQKAGVTGTPAFLLGFVSADGKVKATKKIVGAQPYAAFRDAIETLLSTQKQ